MKPSLSPATILSPFFAVVWRKIGGGEFVHKALYDLRDGEVETVNVVEDKTLADGVVRLSAILNREIDEKVFQ